MLGLVGLAGCTQSRDDSDSEAAPLASAYVSNEYPEERTLSVSLERDGELVYWENVTADAYDAEGDGLGSYQIPVDEFDTSPAVWTLEVLHTHTGEFWVVELGADELTELGLRINIARDDDLEIMTPV